MSELFTAAVALVVAVMATLLGFGDSQEKAEQSQPAPVEQSLIR